MLDVWACGADVQIGTCNGADATVILSSQLTIYMIKDSCQWLPERSVFGESLVWHPVGLKVKLERRYNLQVHRRPAVQRCSERMQGEVGPGKQTLANQMHAMARSPAPRNFFPRRQGVLDLHGPANSRR